MNSMTVQIHIFADNVTASDLPQILRGIENQLGPRKGNQDLLLHTVIDDIHYNCGKRYGEDIVMFKNDHKYICLHESKNTKLNMPL